jgi:hypothetical protein
MALEGTAFVFIRPTSMTIEHRIGLPAVTLYGPAYIQNSPYRNCVGRLRIIPNSEDAARQLPRNAIGWGNIPTEADAMFALTIVYEPQEEARVLGLRNVALAKDTTVELFVEPIFDREVAVLSCEVSEEYSLASEYQAERGF